MSVVFHFCMKCWAEKTIRVPPHRCPNHVQYTHLMTMTTTTLIIIMESISEMASPTCKRFVCYIAKDDVVNVLLKNKRQRKSMCVYQLKTRKCARAKANGMSKIMAKSSSTSVIFSFKATNFWFDAVAKAQDSLSQSLFPCLSLSFFVLHMQNEIRVRIESPRHCRKCNAIRRGELVLTVFARRFACSLCFKPHENIMTAK